MTHYNFHNKMLSILCFVFLLLLVFLFYFDGEVVRQRPDTKGWGDGGTGVCDVKLTKNQ